MLTVKELSKGKQRTLVSYFYFFNNLLEHWETKRKELLVDLLDKMGLLLGFDFDKTHIKTQSYYPQGYGNLENEHSELRRALIDITTGKRPLLMWMANLPNQEQ